MGLLIRRGAVVLCLAGCTPDVTVDPTRVDESRVIAISTWPAEAAPSDTVEWTALVADPSGSSATPLIDWRLCDTPRPLAELGPVARVCVDDPRSGRRLGSGVTVSGTVPTDACRLFGPETPPAMPGTPPGRPADPDSSGGYYQPVIARAPEAINEVTLYSTRLSCGIAGATQRQAAEFQRRYVPNASPIATEIERADTDTLVPEDAPLPVTVGEEIVLRVHWSPCPMDLECDDDCAQAPGCGGAEAYLYFDPTVLELHTQREAISVSWYATAGSFASARTGRADNDATTHSDNAWIAPETAEDVTVWIVLRDDRGGVGWRTMTLQVAP
jgi:hypothetical protein